MDFIISSEFVKQIISTRGSVKNKSTHEEKSQAERDVLFPFQMELQLISKSIACFFSSPPKINPSQLKDGGEKRAGTGATSSLRFYLMERGERTEGLASMG